MLEQEQGVTEEQVTALSEGSEEPKKELTEAEQKELDEKEMRDFLANDENKQKALFLSQEILLATRGKWFTVDQWAKKFITLDKSRRSPIVTEVDRYNAFQKVNMCKMFGHVVERVGTGNDGPDKKGQKLFKITISIDDKIKAIDDVIEYIEGELKTFQLQRKVLVAEKEEKQK